MRKILIALLVLLVLAGGAGAGWWGYRHFLRDPVEVAREQIAKGDIRAAQLELRNAVLKNPSNATAHFELGKLQLRMGDAVAAEKELKAARAAGYKEPGLVPLLARSYLVQQKIKDLLREFSPAGLSQDDAASLLVTRALAQLALQDLPSARASATIAERLDPKLAAAPLAVARIAAAAGDRGQALLKANEAIKLDPKLVEALVFKSELLRSQGDLAQSLAALDAAVAAAPNLPVIRLARARMLLISGEDARAKEDLDAVLKLDPKNLFAQYFQSLLLIRAKDWQEANVAIQKVQPVIAQLPRGEYYYALVKSNVNQLEQASESIDHYLARNKFDPDGYRLRARIALEMGRSADATAALKQVALLGGNQAPGAGGTVTAPTVGGQGADSAENLTRMATQQLEEGDASAAEKDLERSLETQATRADTGAAQVLTALAAGEIDQAQAALDQLARQPRARPEVVGNLTGLVRMANLDFDGAKKAWTETIDAVPSAVPPRVNLARVLALEGQTDEAARELSQILEAEPGNRPALRALVDLEVARGNVDRAIEAVRAAAKVTPDTLALLVTESALLARKGDFTAAYAALDQVPTQQALAPVLLTARALMQVAQNEKQQAADSFRQILLNNPSDLTTRRRLMDMMVALDKIDEAEKLVEDGLALAPGNSDMLQIAVALTYRLKGLDAALAQVDQLLQNPINLPAARLLKGGLYMAAKRYDDAAAAYAAEMKEMPFTALVVSQAAALRAAGKADEATMLLRDWVAKQQDPVVAESLASLDIEANRLDLAEQNLNTVLAARPNDAIALNNLAWIYAARGDKRAVSMARKSYLLSPTAQSADTLGWILAQNGQTDVALLLIQEAAARLRSDPEVYYHLAAVLNQAGKKERAAEVLHTLLTKAKDFPARAKAEALQAELAAAAPAPAAAPTPAPAPAPAAK